MTIFVEICKLCLGRAIKKAIDSSEQKDRSYINELFSLFKFPRDLSLSSGKRHELEGLKKNIEGYKIDDSDEIALHQLREQLIACRSKTTQLALEKQLPIGATEEFLSKAISLIESTYEELKSRGLINAPYKSGPLVTFEYYIAKYFALNIYAQQQATHLQHLTEQVATTAFREREQERARLISAALTQCRLDLDNLRTDLPHFEEAAITQVKHNIRELGDQNRILCERFGFSCEALTQVGAARQDNLLFINCMSEALYDVQLLLKSKDPLRLDDWLNEEEEQQWLNMRRAEEEAQFASARSRFEIKEVIMRESHYSTWLKESESLWTQMRKEQPEEIEEPSRSPTP